MTLRVLLNMLVASGKKAGIGHYANELLRCLSAHAADVEIDVFPSPRLQRCWTAANRMRPVAERIQSLLSPGKSIPGSSPGKVSGLLRNIHQHLLTRRFQQICARKRYDIYHEPNYIPFPSDLPTIATIHDLSVVLHPEWHPVDRVKFFEENFEKSLNRSRHFLTVSDFTRHELIRTFDIQPERITRTYNGVRPALSKLPDEQTSVALHELGLPERYLLHIGTLEPRKNVHMLMEVYCSLPDAFRRDWPLLLVGNWGWNTDSIRSYYHDEARHRGVIHVGYVADKHLAALYNGARALLFPTFYEGFGLPVAEMMACGGAVLASTAGAVAEVAGDCARLIEPEDRDQWQREIVHVAEDEGWWESLRRGTTDRAAMFTWEQCAADTFLAYKSVFKSSSSLARAA